MEKLFKDLTLADGNTPDFSSPFLDQTTDSHYYASMGGITLSGLLSGSLDKNTYANGKKFAVGSITSKDTELTPENFDMIASNMRSFYSQKGIKSKATGYQLANLAYSQNRINDQELVAFQSTLDTIFDNDYKGAQTLLVNKNKGIELAKEKEAGKVKKENIRERNAKKYGVI